MDCFMKMMILALLNAVCCVHSGRSHGSEHDHPGLETRRLTRQTSGIQDTPKFVFPTSLDLQSRSVQVTASPLTSGSTHEAHIVYPDSTDRYGGAESSPMEVLYSWKQVDFDFPSREMRDEMIRDKRFIPLNNLILDVDVYGEAPKRRVFVTLPRVRPGVPVTLATVSHKRRSGANLLAPFPDWASNEHGSCKDSVITSVFRTQVDTCGRLWVLDSGNNDAFNGATSRIVCPPKVMIYDLVNNNRLIASHTIPDYMIANNTLLVTIIVDVRGSDCGNAHAYIADSIAYKIIVFSLNARKFWRLDSILFYPYPDQSTFTISGLSFALRGGVFGLALGPVFGLERRLYFHCIDSVRQPWVDSSDLQNMTLWESNMNAKPQAFNLFNGTRSSQSAAAASSDDGIMFFGVIGTNEIACWDTRKPFGQENIVSVVKDDKTLQFNSGIKVYDNHVYAVTNRLQNYYNRRVPEEEVNYHVLVGDVASMTQGTKCDVTTGDRTDDAYNPNSDSVDYDVESLFTSQASR